MKQIMAKVSALACAFMLVLGVLASCTPPSSAVDSAQQENRSYMSQVNGVMGGLGESLESFVDAVSRGDLVNMRTQAANAYKALDDLSGIAAPESLADVQKKYVDASAKMRTALDVYIELYTEVSTGSLEQSSYADRIAHVQSLYDEGVELFKQADEAAAGK